MKSYFEWLNAILETLNDNRDALGINSAVREDYTHAHPFISIEATPLGRSDSEASKRDRMNIKLVCFGEAGETSGGAFDNSMIIAIRTLILLEKTFINSIQFDDFITVAGFYNANNHTYSENPAVTLSINVNYNPRSLCGSGVE